VRRLISLFSRSSGLVDQTFFQCAAGNGEGQQVVVRVAEHGLHLRELPPEHAGDDVEPGVHELGVG
jgi:hypothetical protein